MYVRPRPRFRPRNAGGVPFSPALLFTSGVAGAWYDPSDVLLNWRTNLLTYTEQLDNAAWTLSNASRSVGVTDPNGGTAAATITATAANGYIRYAYSASAAAATNSIYIRRRTGTGAVYLNPPDNASSLTLSLTSSWQRVQVSSTGTIVSLIVILQASGDAIDIAFPQLELGSTATTYQAITTPEQTYLLYDPQPVLYQDSAGTTPVTAVEQPVGLMLDKSQGLVLGSELVTNGDFATDLSGWTVLAGTVTWQSGAALLGNAGATTNFQQIPAGLSASKRYVVTVDYSVTAGNLTFWFGSGGSQLLVGVTGSGTYRAVVPPTSGLDLYFRVTAGGSATIDNISVKEIAGNHASQATAASRPVLRARYNLLTYSEQFDNAAWTKSALTVTANATTAPYGTSTADKLAEDAANSTHYAAGSATTTAANYAFSCYIKAAERSFVLLWNSTANFGRVFDLAGGTVSGTVAGVNQATADIENVGNGWYRCTIYGTCTAASNSFRAYTMTDATTFTYTGDGTSGIYIWGADLRTGSSAGTYQRIAAATDYATAGFLPYLALDGTDDSMNPPSSILTGATAATEMHAGWRPAGNSTSNGAVFSNFGTDSINDHEPFSDNTLYSGFASTNRQTFATLAAIENPYILEQVQTGTTLAAYRNGTQLSTTKTVNFALGSTPKLFLGNVGATPFYYGGRFFGGVAIGKVLSASETTSLRNYLAAKSGVTL